MRTRELHVEEDREVQGVTRISCSADWPRPWVLVVGSVHGDEPCGRFAIEALAEDARRGDLPLRRGTVITLHGNPEASESRTRSTAGGADLNRLFDFSFERELIPTRWTLEHHRALALRPLVASVDMALDLHSARARTPAFAICMSAPGSFELAMQLGLEYVTVGWSSPGMLGHQVVLSPLARRERPGVAVECGAHDDPETTEVARNTLLRFLETADLLDHPCVPPAPKAPIVLRLLDSIKRPGAGFRFERPLVGLERLTPGEVVGSDANLEVRMRSECYAIMPNDGVAVGEDMLYLAGPT
ncbi:MAG: succinylglutamate desuccinylase/aspartoacylase family protein [Polyangiaceae bacterium]|nr:succinylglutamate desuccinylase/aspartoacylase family protein [Polyangiaceae bacterium]